MKRLEKLWRSTTVVLLCMSLLLSSSLGLWSQSLEQSSDSEDTQNNQTFLPLVTANVATEQEATVSASGVESNHELASLKAYLRYYKASNVPQRSTAFGLWRTAATTGTPTGTVTFDGGYFNNIDTSYYRAVCNTAAISAAAIQSTPGTTSVDVDGDGQVDADLDRAKALLLAAINEYDDNPRSVTGPNQKDGWGFPKLFSNQTGDKAYLTFGVPLVGYPCAIAAALLWNQLTVPADRQRVQNVLSDLADRITTWAKPGQITVYDAYAPRDQTRYTLRRTSVNGFNASSHDCDNTPAEEASGYASFLAALSQFHRTHANATTWRFKAHELMDYAYSNVPLVNQAVKSLNIRSGCGTPPDAGTLPYANTVTNHAMYPNPIYAFSLLVDSAQAVLPWSAQGIKLNFNPVTNITSLGQSHGNDALYGRGGVLATNFANIYNTNIRYANGANGQLLLTADLSLKGTTYKAIASSAATLGSAIDFRNKSYLGRAGVGDWGFGLDFQNSAFAFISWVELTTYPALGSFDWNYAKLRAYQNSLTGSGNVPSFGYFPSWHSSGCNGALGVQPGTAGWQWTFLTSSCQATGSYPLVEFYEGTSNFTLPAQIQQHFFLNSFKGFNHVVAYMTMRDTPWWPPSGGLTTLPNFAN